MLQLFTKRFFTAPCRQIGRTLLVFALMVAGSQAAKGQAVTCPPNIDFSFGNLNNWYCFAGSCATGPSPVTGRASISVTFTGPIGPTPGPAQHEVTTGAGTDPYGGFSVTAPGGGLFSLKLGNKETGQGAERVQYYVHVPAGFNNYSFAYRYACVLQDGGLGHDTTQQAGMNIVAYDSATGLPIPCPQPSYVVGGSLPGFYQSSLQSDVLCLGWTNGTLNLSGQGGKTIIVEITTNDCTLGGHFGYGYFDVISCGQFAAAITFCNLAQNYVTVTAPGGYKSYKWFKGPVASGAPISTAISWNAPIPNPCGYYICVLEPFNTNGCTDTIRTKSICDFTIQATPDTTCNGLGNPIQLGVTKTSGPGGVYTYQWNADPSLSATNIQNPIATPSGSKLYIVTVRDSINCSRRDTVVIQNPAFKLQLGPDRVTCLGTPITFNPSLTPAAPGYVFKWTPTTQLSNGTILNPTYTPLDTGLVRYILRVDSGVCAASDTFRVRTIPNKFELHDTAVCQLAAIFPDIRGSDSFRYSWMPAPPAVISNPNVKKPTIIADTTRTFIVTARYPGCPDIVNSMVMRVEPLPNVDLGPDTIQKCFYTPLYLTAHVKPEWFTNYSYQWNANEFIDEVASPIITFTGPADTTLIITVKTPLGCTGVDSTRVQVYEGHFGTVTPSDTAVCPRNPVVLKAGGGISYLWRPSLYLSDSTGATVVANPQTSKDYTLYVTDRNGCVDTLPVSLQVYAETVVSLPDSAELYPGQSLQLDPGGNALYFNWFPTVGLSNAGVSNPVATPSVNTLYYVTGTTEAGCKAVDSMYILVHEESVLDMPNAFTPGSSSNNTFKVSRLGIASLKSFRIYNRWGTKVFETSDIDKGWNGQFNGEPQPLGVYIYTVEAVTYKGRAVTKQGNVTLIR